MSDVRMIELATTDGAATYVNAGCVERIDTDQRQGWRVIVYLTGDAEGAYVVKHGLDREQAGRLADDLAWWMAGGGGGAVPDGPIYTRDRIDARVSESRVSS